MQKLVYAKYNNNGMSAQKMRLVAALIRGKNALAAADILRFTNKFAAKDMLKVLNSAIANAVNNENMDKKELMIVQVLVDNATTRKFGRAVSRGRYHQILRRNCHISVAVSDGSEGSVSTKPAVVKSETKAKNVKAADKTEAKAKTKPEAKKAAVTKINKANKTTK